MYIRDNEIGDRGNEFTENEERRKKEEGGRRKEKGGRRKEEGEEEKRNEEAAFVAEVVVSRFVSAARLNIYDPLFGTMQPFSEKRERRETSAILILEKSPIPVYFATVEKVEKSSDDQCN